MEDDEDLDEYIDNLELILKRRWEIDDMLIAKLSVFKQKLREEEEQFRNMAESEKAKEEEEEETKQEEDVFSLSPIDMLKTKEFYIMW